MKKATEWYGDNIYKKASKTSPNLPKRCRTRHLLESQQEIHVAEILLAARLAFQLPKMCPTCCHKVSFNYQSEGLWEDYVFTRESFHVGCELRKLVMYTEKRVR